MYVKAFSKMLDSSIWTEPQATRLVWITLLLAMDQDGYAHFSSIKNLATRAQVELKEAEEAVRILSSPDPESSDPDHEGRRVERIPGGFNVLNAAKYRKLKNQVSDREQNRLRQKAWRKRYNEKVTSRDKKCDDASTSASAYAYASVLKTKNSRKNAPAREGFELFWSSYPKKVSRKDAEKAFKALNPSDELLNQILTALEKHKESKQWIKEDGEFVPLASSWINKRRWEDEFPERERQLSMQELIELDRAERKAADDESQRTKQTARGR